MRNNNYTEALESVRLELAGQFNSLHSRESVNNLINQFAARSCSSSERVGTEQKIVNILECCNKYTQYKNQHKGTLCQNRDDYHEVSKAAEMYRAYAEKIPTESELDHKFFDGLYKIYTNYKSSSDYMERLTKRRMKEINPSLVNDGDSTRVLILKQFLSETDFLRNTPYYSKKFEVYINGMDCVKKDGEGYDYSSINEDVFAPLLTTVPKRKLINILKYFGKIISVNKEMLSLLPIVFKDSVLELNSSATGVIDICFTKDVGKLSVNDIRENVELKAVTALFEQIEACRRTIGKKEKDSTNPSGFDFDKVNQRYKDANKRPRSDEDDITVLQLIDDLAAGFFDDQRLTREKLYIYAIAFKMSFFTGAQNEIFLPETDIQKNLFYEYYADNLVNDFNNQTRRKSEKEPNGYGINYKNFAEIIFLYYIRKSEMSPKEKLQAAYQTIEDYKKHGKNKKKLQAVQEANVNTSTAYYRDNFLSNLLNEPEAAFKQNIWGHYICRSDIGMVRNREENRTAEKVYRGLLGKIMALEKKATSLFYDENEIKLSSEAIYTYCETKYLNNFITDYCKKCEYGTDLKQADQCPYYKTDECKSNKVNLHLEDEEKRMIELLCGKKQIPIFIKSFQTVQYHNPIKDDCQFISLLKNIETRLKISAADFLSNILMTEFTEKGKNEEFLLVNEIIEEFLLENETTDGISLKNDTIKEFLLEDETIEEFLSKNEKKRQKFSLENEIKTETFLSKNKIKDTITRTGLIALYYYYVIIKAWADALDDEGDRKIYRSFSEYYNYFCEDKSFAVKINGVEKAGLNACLEAAGYQQINSKNIFDIFVIFLAFKDNYKRNYQLPENMG